MDKTRANFIITLAAVSVIMLLIFNNLVVTSSETKQIDNKQYEKYFLNYMKICFGRVEDQSRNISK